MWWASKEVLNAMSVCVKFALQKASTKGIPIWTQDFSAERSICAPPERSNRSIEDDAERRPGGLWKKRVSSQGWDCAHCSLVASLRKPPVTGHFPLYLEKLAQYYFFFFFFPPDDRKTVLKRSPFSDFICQAWQWKSLRFGIYFIWSESATAGAVHPMLLLTGSQRDTNPRLHHSCSWQLLGPMFRHKILQLQGALHRIPRNIPYFSSRLIQDCLYFSFLWRKPSGALCCTVQNFSVPPPWDALLRSKCQVVLQEGSDIDKQQDQHLSSTLHTPWES